jgi:hypothetical protein
MSVYDSATDSLVQAASRIRHGHVTPENYTAISINIRKLHEIIDANNSITIDDPRVKTIFQEIARLINDHANRTMKGGKKSKRKSKRNSSKRANKKKKTIKSKSKRRLRTRKY